MTLAAGDPKGCCNSVLLVLFSGAGKLAGEMYISRPCNEELLHVLCERGDWLGGHGTGFFDIAVQGQARRWIA